MRNDINWQTLKVYLIRHLDKMIHILQQMHKKLEADTLENEKSFLNTKIAEYRKIKDDLPTTSLEQEKTQFALILTLSLHDKLLAESKLPNGNFHPPLDFLGEISEFMMKHKVAILTTVLIVVGTALAVTPLGMAMAGVGLGVLGINLITSGGIMAVIGCFIPVFAWEFGHRDGQESLAGLSSQALSEGTLFKGKHDDKKEVQGEGEGEGLNIETNYYYKK